MLILYNSAEEAHRPCDKASRSHRDEAQMAHHCSSRDPILIHKLYREGIRIQTRSRNILHLFGLVIWEEGQGNRPSHRLSVTTLMLQLTLINVHCLSINRRSRSIGRTLIAYEHPLMQIPTTANKGFYWSRN
jgi:hypothetical protein